MFVFVVLIVQVFCLNAQNCAVLTDSLKGNYEGGCKKGRANGNGVASGIDYYKGEFKDGYPDGKGKYVWNNGNWYEGEWKAGKFDGQGTWHNVNNMDQDSGILAGFWKQGKYAGKYERPYIMRTMTNGIEDVAVYKVKVTNVSITVKTNAGAGLSISPKHRLTNVLVQKGRYERRMDDENASGVANRYVLYNVEYPFYAILVFDNEQLQIELLENAGWNITVTIGR